VFAPTPVEYRAARRVVPHAPRGLRWPPSPRRSCSPASRASAAGHRGGSCFWAASTRPLAAARCAVLATSDACLTLLRPLLGQEAAAQRQALRRLRGRARQDERRKAPPAEPRAGGGRGATAQGIGGVGVSVPDVGARLGRARIRGGACGWEARRVAFAAPCRDRRGRRQTGLARRALEPRLVSRGNSLRGPRRSRAGLP
jgi:hypothetical protein